MLLQGVPPVILGVLLLFFVAFRLKLLPLGGAYSMQLDAHVRMDLAYSAWSPRTRAVVDAITVLMLIFYLVMLLVGGISSTEYAIEYKETSYSAWSPYMAPIKIVMCFGIALMLLQAISTFFKDLYAARGETL